jgi:hypothetical protein
MTTETINLFYRRTDLNQVQNLQNTFLYSSNLFNNVVGNGFYNVVLYETYNEVTGPINFDIEDCTYFLNKGALFFKLALSNQSESNIFNPGVFESQILGGNGLYLNAKGTITIIVDENLIRNVIIKVTY